MTASPELPRADASLTDSTQATLQLRPAREWFAFWQQLRQFVEELGGTPEQLAALEARVAALEAAGAINFTNLGSVQVGGSAPDFTIALVGDTAAPGATLYYGTGPDGAKGWVTVASAVLGADSVVQAVDATTGVSTFALDGDDPAPGTGFVYSTHLTTGAKGWHRPALFESTGLLDGGALSVNAGDPTTFDVAAAVVGFTDYSSNPAAPERAVAVYGPSTGNSVPSLAVIATYVGIQAPGLVLVTQASPFSATQRRTIVPLGAVISNGVQLIAVNNLPDVMRAGINQFQDLMAAIGPMNLSGNVITANGPGLGINKSAGVVFKQGANFFNDANNPHGLTLAALTGASFQYRLSDGTQYPAVTALDPNNYESPPGTLGAVPAANRFTIQRVSVFTSNLLRLQYGQFDYGTMAAAEASLVTEAFITEQNIAENGILLGFIILRDGTTDLTNPGDAKFIPASKFGGPVGTGGTSITNTDALPEGSANLYHTAARVLATVLAGLSTASAAVITAADSVLSALGKLQAQITANVAAIAGKEPAITAGTAGQALNGLKAATNRLTTDGAAQDWNLRAYGGATRIFGQRAGGTEALPTAVAASTNLFAFNGDGWDGTDFFTGANTQYVTTEAWGPAAHGCMMNFRTIATGSTTLTTRWTLDHQGFVPFANNAYTLGSASLRLSTVFTVNLNTSGTVTHTGTLTPPQITANQNDYAPTNHATSYHFRLSTDASRTMTSLAGGVDGLERLVTNVGSFDLVLEHASASGTAANRFLCPNSANLTLNPNDSVRLRYDGTSARWRVLGT